jgi:hypothetical protein
MFGLRQHHLMGMFAGALLGLVASGLGGVFGLALAPNDGLFWGAVVGGLITGMPQFAQAGAVLTGSENRTWNALVGIVGGLALIGVIAALATLLIKLFS